MNGYGCGFGADLDTRSRSTWQDMLCFECHTFRCKMDNRAAKFQARVPDWVKTWWDSQALREVGEYKGKPYLSKFLIAIASGEYEIKKKGVDNP